MRVWTTTSAIAAAGVCSLAQGAVFNPGMFSSAPPATYGTQIASLDVATTSYDFPFGAGFTTSGYVDNFGSVELDRTQLVSTVYRVNAPTNVGGVSLSTNDLVFAYTIRLVEASTNTVTTMKEFQVGLLNFGVGDRMDGSSVKGRGFVATGVPTPVGGNAGDLESIGSFGASHDWEWGVTGPEQLQNSQTITLLMFTEPRPIVQGLGNFAAPPGQQAGVDPLASGAPVLIPAVPAPGAGALWAVSAGLLAARRRRGR